jgi:hypothetical protein
MIALKIIGAWSVAICVVVLLWHLALKYGRRSFPSDS